MGKVIAVAGGHASGRERPRARSGEPRRRRGESAARTAERASAGTSGRARRTRTALVLGGGGFTGGAFEIGALQALDLLLGPGSANHFDVYVGTSAGAFLAALVANGISADDLRDALEGRPTAITVDRPAHDTLLRLNFGGLLTSAYKVPLAVAGTALRFARHPRATSLVDAIFGVAEALPSGVYDGSGIEAYVRRVLTRERQRTNDFRELGTELYLPATDIDTCERIVFGEPEFDDVPISEAVAASAALPMVYVPRRIKGRTLVDGGIVSTTNVDVAVEHGADLVVVINPLVPFRRADAETGRSLGERGFLPIGYQAFRMLAYERLHRAVHSWQERFPGVDIVLVEPAPDDRLLFETHILDFARARAVARRALLTVGEQLLAAHRELAPLWQRHGLEPEPTRLREALDLSASRDRRSALGRIAAIPARAGRALAGRGL